MMTNLFLYWRKPNRQDDSGIVTAHIYKHGFVGIAERDTDGMPICYARDFSDRATAIKTLRSEFSDLGYQEILPQ